MIRDIPFPASKVAGSGPTDSPHPGSRKQTSLASGASCR